MLGNITHRDIVINHMPKCSKMKPHAALLVLFMLCMHIIIIAVRYADTLVPDCISDSSSCTRLCKEREE